MRIEELKNGIYRGFIDHTVDASEHYSPKLLTNGNNEKILTTIQSELSECDEFMFSVAFITSGGVSVLKEELKNLNKRNVRGRIVASQYQNFTDPKALKELKKLGNIDVRIIPEEQKMHAKCFIFRKGDNYDLIIGSSNLTNGALCENEEWNIRLSSTQEGEVIRDAIKEFEMMFGRAVPIDDEWLQQYEEIYGSFSHRRHKLERQFDSEIEDESPIVPNKMQREALSSIRELREDGRDRALVISATGTGKTYLSAFDVCRHNPGRFLFIVHRETILTKAMESFERVIGKGTKKMGILSGNRKDWNSDYLFAMIQTISQKEVLERFSREHFDYILIDEVHHVGAETYQKILNHFSPKFLLGMTATPERMDDFDIFKLFDYNVAYEIRLKQAMEYKLICPFHYFGIMDIEVDGEVLEEKSDFNRLTSDQRVNHIVENIEYYKYCGNRVRGIIFCSKVEEAKCLSQKFNAIGYRTTYLSSETAQHERDRAIELLEKEEREEGLDYIFVVDLFNEGIDIPSVNQVVMLRPTQSPIVFVQQLGRGLRHYYGKEYVVVIDFIGNYESNYLIPIALSGDRSYNKDNVRYFMAECNNIIPGRSIVSFDSISKEKIFRNIDKTNFSQTKIIKEAYTLLKRELGRVPKLTDYDKFESIDAMKFIENWKSYQNFLTKYEENHVVFSENEQKILQYLSKFICSGKRLDEIILLEIICSGSKNVMDEYKQRLGVKLDENKGITLINLFNGAFFEGEIQRDAMISQEGQHCRISENFSEMLKRQEFKDAIQDMIDFGKINFQKYREEIVPGTDLVLFKKYTYTDVCRLLNWGKNINAQNIGGYKYDDKTKTFPIFINYEKGEEVVESQRYEDHFISQTIFMEAPKSTDPKDGKNMTRMKNSERESIAIYLFVRKNKDDEGSKEFYFLGRVRFEDFVDMKGKKYMMRLRLDNAVRHDIYDYITSSSGESNQN